MMQLKHLLLEEDETIEEFYEKLQEEVDKYKDKDKIINNMLIKSAFAGFKFYIEEYTISTKRKIIIDYKIYVMLKLWKKKEDGRYKL